MYFSVLGSSIGLVFIVGSCMLVKRYMDLTAETLDTPIGGGGIVVAGGALALDGIIAIGILRTWGIINFPGLGTSWFIAIMVLTFVALYIYWISYLIREGDIKDPLMIVAVLFAGLVLTFIATSAVCFIHVIISPDSLLRLLSEYLNAEV